MNKVLFVHKVFFFICTFQTLVFGQILAWETNGLAGNEGSVSSTTTHANLNTSSLSRGAGLNPNSLANTFNSSNFSGTTLGNALSSNHFLQFSVNANASYKVSLSTLDVNFRRSSTGPNKFQWQYSLDGFLPYGNAIHSECFIQ